MRAHVDAIDAAAVLVDYLNDLLVDSPGSFQGKESPANGRLVRNQNNRIGQLSNVRHGDQGLWVKCDILPTKNIVSPVFNQYAVTI